MCFRKDPGLVWTLSSFPQVSGLVLSGLLDSSVILYVCCWGLGHSGLNTTRCHDRGPATEDMSGTGREGGDVLYSVSLAPRNACQKRLAQTLRFALGETSVHLWLAMCFSSDYWKKMAKVLRSAGHHLVPVKENLVDKIWTDRPERPCKPLLTLGLDYTGQSHSCDPESLPCQPILLKSYSRRCYGVGRCCCMQPCLRHRFWPYHRTVPHLAWMAS